MTTPDPVKPDLSFHTLRRVTMLEDRLELIYASLYLATLICFIALMVALYTVREDILTHLKKD